jgi:D-alanine-D-alanine ligase
MAQALREKGYDVDEIDVGKDIGERLVSRRPAAVLLGLHGRYGEDGSIQGLLESMFIPYSGSGVLASALAMDKVAAKQIFLGHGISTPASHFFRSAQEALDAGAKLNFPFPVVVKPSREGSSVGVHICHTQAEYRAAVDDVTRYAGVILVEKYVKGREVNCAVLDDKCLGAIEIVPSKEHAFYDYEAKYQKGSGTQYLFPAPLPKEQYQRVCDVALSAHISLGCSGVTRSDVIVSDQGEVFLLEVNTLPGMTATSLFPKIAAGNGMDFGALCERLLLGASLKS